MSQLAWTLKGIEKALGTQDKKTTSELLFSAAANLAVVQNNSKALKEIIALEPMCAKFKETLKLKGATRGTGVGSIVSMPQIVTMPGSNPGQKWIDKLSELKPYQQPVYSPQLLAAQFRGMSVSKAQNVSFLVNRGRMLLEPKLIAMGALEMASQSEKDMPSQLDPKNVLAEASDLAIELGDRQALDFIIGLYKTSALKDENKAKSLSEELKLMGSTRGISESEEKALWIGAIMLGAKFIISAITD